MSRELRMLLVEDEPIDVMTVERSIRERALPVRLQVVESAEAALERLGIGSGSGVQLETPLDLIVADLRLPRLSGLDLLEQVKSSSDCCNIPVVMLSTSSQDAEIARAYGSGAAAYFVKPIVFHEYADTIERIVDFYARAQAPGEASHLGARGGEPHARHYLEDEVHALLRENAVVFEYLQYGATDGLWLWDLENPEHEWMSPGFWRTFGHDPTTKPHLAAAWQDMVPTEDLQVAVANLEKHCADPSHPYDQVLRYRHRDGSTVWIHCRGFAIRDRAGKPVRMLGVHTDVSALKAAETSVAEKTSQLAEIDALVSIEESAMSNAEWKNVMVRIRSILRSDA